MRCPPLAGMNCCGWTATRRTEVARHAMHGQPVFVIAQPASPFVWVNFATPLNDVVQVVDSRTP